MGEGLERVGRGARRVGEGRGRMRLPIAAAQRTLSGHTAASHSMSRTCDNRAGAIAARKLAQTSAAAASSYGDSIWMARSKPNRDAAGRLCIKHGQRRHRSTRVMRVHNHACTDDAGTRAHTSPSTRTDFLSGPTAHALAYRSTANHRLALSWCKRTHICRHGTRMHARASTHTLQAFHT